jgi:RNA polymerase sigma factor (sigma-70 family)
VREAYARHGSALVRYLAVRVREPALAEDLAQEAFLRLARVVAEGRIPDNVPAWLFRVGANLVASRARHVAVASRVVDRLPLEGPVASPEAQVLEVERNRAVERGLATLPPAHRTALLMAAQGFSGPEIAAHLGRTPLATRALLCRARGRMRLWLDAAGIER